MQSIAAILVRNEFSLLLAAKFRRKFRRFVQFVGFRSSSGVLEL